MSDIPSNFMDLDDEFSAYENSKVVIVPIPYEVYELPNIALDIDEPADIEQLKTLGSHTRAYRELIKLGLIKEEIEKTG